MVSTKASHNLYVGINGQHIGHLERRGSSYAFTYDSEWLSRKDAFPISLSMPITKSRHTGEVVRFYFDNLLPDDQEIRKLIVDRVGAHSTDTIDLLSEIGRDCVGSLSFTATPIKTLANMQLVPLNEHEVANHLRRAAKRKTLGMGDESTFRISLAGAQEKTALTYYQGIWHEPQGTTPTTHIFKLPMGEFGNGIDLQHSVDNEWFCLRLLHNLNIFNVAQAKIETFEELKVLVVERFDRIQGEDGMIYRLTQEDMCQALGKAGQSKYEDKGGPGAREISALLSYSTESIEDRYSFFLAQYVFWLMMGIDGHAKNFSIFIDHSGYWLTPIYDVISAHPISAQFRRKELKMAMRVLSKNSHYIWHNILYRHWSNHAKNTGLDPNEAMAHIELINNRMEQAISDTFAEVPNEFHQSTGEQIANGIISVMKKI